MNNSKIFSTIIALLFYFITHATEFHVSKTGNNQNDGSLQSPLLTIQAAADIAQPGDFIIVHSGVYRERINPPRGGHSDDQRITYKAAEGENVTITGSEAIDNWEQVKDDIWKVELSTDFFDEFNPYDDVISGDWFFDNELTHHTGAVYLNGHWLNEAKNKDILFEPMENETLWFAEVTNASTTIWAQFKDINPNDENVEINVRQSVFYPEKEGINYITVSGFKLKQAATPWAPPTAEQIGLIGTHWSKGWIIENNDVAYSICSGITLGKYGDEFDNKSGDTAKGYEGTIERAISYGWTKENVGSHIIRNNVIHHCEQAGIVGSLGAIFSEISNNEVYDIHVKRLFSGMEMAGIKIHAPIDMLVSNNYIHHCWRGVWMDWMAQGTRITGNLLHDNDAAHDMFIEVNHGPMLVDNNILLSPSSIRNLSGGIVFAHNLFRGIDVPETNLRETPYFKAHSTELVDTKVIAHGDNQYYNNIFMSFDNNPWPVRMGAIKEGNFFGLGAYQKDTFSIRTEGNVYFDKATSFEAEMNGLENPKFKTNINLTKKQDGVYLDITLDKKWLLQKRQTVTTALIGNAQVPNLPYVHPDGTSYYLDRDYVDVQRDVDNPSPGPFSTFEKEKLTIKIWDFNYN